MAASDNASGAVRVRSSHGVVRTASSENDIAGVSVVTV
jgi:hypothetical protein